MHIKDYLVDLIIDFYQSDCKLDGSYDENFLKKFYSRSHRPIGSKNFLMLNQKQVITNQRLEDLYIFLVDSNKDLPYSLSSIIFFLVSNYYVYNYLNKDDIQVIHYLKTKSLKEIEDLYLNNKFFGISLLSAFFDSLFNEKTNINNREMIFKNGDQTSLLNFEKSCTAISDIEFHSSMRTDICNLYNFYISVGYNDIDALNGVWNYFIYNFQPYKIFKKAKVNIFNKRAFNNFVLGLIYADVYEDIFNDSIIKSETYEQRLADLFCILNVSMGSVNISKDKNIRNIILKHFILLQDSGNKKQLNRIKTYQDDRIKVLKKVNSSFEMDELTF